MISASEYKSFIDSTPQKKTSLILCQVYEKLFDLDPFVFTFPRFRQELVYSIDRNYPLMNAEGQAFIASSVCSFLLRFVFGREASFFAEKIILSNHDLYLRHILDRIQQHFCEDAVTLYSEKLHLDDEMDDNLSVYLDF